MISNFKGEEKMLFKKFSWYSIFCLLVIACITNSTWGADSRLSCRQGEKTTTGNKYLDYSGGNYEYTFFFDNGKGKVKLLNGVIYKGSIETILKVSEIIERDMNNDNVKDYIVIIKTNVGYQYLSIVSGKTNALILRYNELRKRRGQIRYTFSLNTICEIMSFEGTVIEKNNYTWDFKKKKFVLKN